MVASAYVVRSTVLGAAAVLSITSCARPVAVQAPPVTDACEPILASAPIRVLGELQRETTPRDVAAVVWGDPPIVLVCGARVTTAPDAQVVTVDGVDWIAETSEAGTIFTTQDTDPSVQVRVPRDYRPEIDAVAEITDIIPVP